MRHTPRASASGSSASRWRCSRATASIPRDGRARCANVSGHDLEAAMSAAVTAAHPTGLDPAHYTRHDLHSPERIWTEKNCYVDIWIELVHALGLEPNAMM